MLQVIQEWLMNSLGLILDLKKINLGDKVKDGYFISQILCGFEVISKEELALVKQSEDRDVAMKNFLHFVLIWLGRLGISLKDVDLENLLDGNEKTAIILLYELYLALQNKSKLHMITQRKIIEKSKPHHPKFEVKKVNDSKLDDFNIKLNPYYQQIMDNKDILKWHKDRLSSLKKQCEESRKEYTRYFNTRRNEKPPSLICNCDIKCACPKFKTKKNQIDFPEEASVDFTYEELVDKFKKSEKIVKHEPDFEEAKKVVRKLKTKRMDKKERDLEKMRLHTELCEELWNEMVKNQEKQFDEIVEEKVTSQSFYEKQMINKMFQIKHQQKVIRDNRNFVDEETTKQKEDDVMQKLYMEQRISDECVCDYLHEKERILQLHSMVYAEKMRLKKRKIERICRETAEDLVNLALRVVEFKEDSKEEPCKRRYNDWVSLFVRCGPILPLVVPTENIIQDLSDLSDTEEAAYLEEIDRQEIIDTRDFEKYNKNEWPWELKNVEDFQFNFNLIQRGMNVIGYIVHRLLIVKYPTARLMPKPDFKFEHAVCINGLSDTTVLEKLQSLLSYKDIKVFEVLDALNYCLNQYAKEKKMEESEDSQSVEVELEEKKVRSSSRNLGKGKKGKTSKKNLQPPSRSSIEENVSEELPRVMNKKNQTPRFYPSEEIKMSHAAILGEVAKNTLNKGEPLTDYLLAAIIVEYLYTISEKKGWALVNYPTNYNQAVSLEENLSSTPLCNDLTAIKSIMDLIDLEKKTAEGIVKKEKEVKRYSKIFPQPHKLREDDVYETALTAYIKIIKKPLDNAEDAETSLPPITRYIADSADPLEKFYAEQGCSYSIYYETFDYNTVKYLARLVIGDFTLPRKPSIELFGKSVLLGQEENENESGSKLAKSSKEISIKEKEKKKLFVQKEDKEEVPVNEKKDRKSKQKISVSSSNVVMENKQVQVPPLEDLFEMIVEEEDPNITPGEEKWRYIEIPMPEDLLLVLAKICENMENLYIEDFKQVLFMRRVILNNVQPYVTHTKSHLLEFLERPDDRQGALHEFQMAFNGISECLRSDDEVKAELHCRVYELRCELLETSEKNLNESLEEREKIVEKHWLRREVHELAQTYLCAMQLELDRFIDTIQLLTDYYVTGITNIQPEEPPLAKELLKSLDSDNVRSYENHSIWTDAFDTRYFTDKLIGKVAKCCDFVEKIKGAALRTVENTQGKFVLGKPKPEKLKGKGTSIIKISDIVRDNMDMLLEEWKVAIEGECERVLFRIRLLKCDSDHRFREMATKVRDMMNEIYGLIRRRYNNEQSSIEHLCDVISNAIENETPIQMELKIDKDQFYVQPEVLLFPDDIPPLPPPVKEWKKDSVFTIAQLKKLQRLLLDLAPSGVMPERQFTFILQDMLTHDVEDGEEPLAPDLWRQLTTLEVEKVTRELFSKSECIHWKDFIIYNLMIDMPSSEQLIDLKRCFRKKDKTDSENVSVKDFNSFTFWFENCFCENDESDMKRLGLMRELVCDLYKVDENSVNYSAMLVDFCKDRNGTVGFAKLLGLILDRPVCWDSNIGKKFVRCENRKRKIHEELVKQREEEINEEKTFAKDILGEIADNSVHQCSSVVITELEETSKSVEILSMDGESCGEECICDLECYCGKRLEETFSNVPIGAEEGFDPSLVYFLEFEHVLAAEAAALHWHTRVQNLDGKSFRQCAEEIYNACRNPNFNNAVLAHDFLNHRKFSRLLANTTRFLDKNPSNFIHNLIQFRK